MLRSTFLFPLVLMSALFGISANAQAQSKSRLDEIETISRPQLESPSEDPLDLMDPRNEDDGDDNDSGQDEEPGLEIEFRRR